MLALVRTLATVLAVLASVLVVPVAEARTPTVTTTIATPPSLWPEAGILVRLTPAKLTIRVHGEPRVRPWTAFAFPMSSATAALVPVAAGRAEGALVDRPLTAAEARRFRAVPLFLDADVVLAAPSDDLCRTGLAAAAVREWLQPGATPPRPVAVPVLDDGAARPVFGAPAAEPPVRVVPEPEAIEAAVRGEALALVAWSAARTALEHNRVCAVPLDGVAPTEATIVGARYPAARRVAWVHRRARPRIDSRSERRAWLRFLRSERLRDELAGGDGRRRLLLNRQTGGASKGSVIPDDRSTSTR
jgi:hypothetical protein